jgi:hypothetical protein
VKKLLIIPILFLSSFVFSQRIDTLIGYKGKLIKDTSITIAGNYLFTPTSTSIAFDSTKVQTNTTLNTTGDSVYVWKGEVIVSRLKISGTTTALSTLTDAATVAWDYSTQGTEAKVTLGGNRTLSISNLPSGRVVYLTLAVIQDATGSRTLTLPSGTKVISGGSGAVTLTTAASATDILSFRWNGTTLFCTYGKNYN